MADKYKSIAGISQFDKVVVAYGENFADALSGSSLSIMNGAPVLLVNNNAATKQKIADYIQKNLAPGGEVFIVGGTAVVSDDFANSLRDEKYYITRLFGDDRYMTNLEVLKATDIGDDVLICSGESFPDAVTASQTGKAVMLIGRRLSDSQREFLKSQAGKNLYIIGGTGVVSTDIESELKQYSSNVTRICGADRALTATEVAKYFYGTGTNSVVMASGDSFADNICAGLIANKTSSPILFAGENRAYYNAAANYLAGRGISRAYAIGGQSIVTPNFAGTAMYQSQ